MEMQVEIRIKKCGISNQPDVCIFDDPCLSKFGALRGCVRNPQTILGFPSVPCGTRESAHCLWLVGHTPWIVQTWKRHGIRCKHSAGRNARIFFQRIFYLHFHMKSRRVFLIILLIPPKRSMLIAAIPFLIEAYSSWIPLFSHACIISSGHREDCTSPMCALRRKNIQIRD